MSDQPTLGQPTIERAVPHRHKAGLTARELQVLGLMAAGLPNKQIADRLFISLHTARNHVKSVLHKLAAHSRLEAVAIAVHDGFTERDIAEDAEGSGDSSASTQRGSLQPDKPVCWLNGRSGDRFRGLGQSPGSIETATSVTASPPTVADNDGRSKSPRYRTPEELSVTMADQAEGWPPNPWGTDGPRLRRRHRGRGHRARQSGRAGRGAGPSFLRPTPPTPWPQMLQGQAQGPGSGADVVVVDLAAYRRGHTHPGERGHIVEGGPVSVALRPGASAEDAFIKAVTPRRRAPPRPWAHFGRHIPVELRSALELGPAPGFDGVSCTEPGCNRRHGLEWDHVGPVAHHGPDLVPPQPSSDLQTPPPGETERDRQAGLFEAPPP